jgi:regulator of sigma E protease
MTYAPFVPIVGVLDGSSPAAAKGAEMRTGDLITGVNGQPVRNWTDVQRHVGKFMQPAHIVYFRGTETPGVPQIHLLKARWADIDPKIDVDATLHRHVYTGLEHAEMFVAKVDPGSPADSAGLRPGDLIVSLDGKPVAYWTDLDQRLQSDDEDLRSPEAPPPARSRRSPPSSRRSSAKRRTTTATPSPASCSARRTTSTAAPARWSRSKAASATR